MFNLQSSINLLQKYNFYFISPSFFAKELVVSRKIRNFAVSAAGKAIPGLRLPARSLSKRLSIIHKSHDSRRTTTT